MVVPLPTVTLIDMNKLALIIIQCSKPGCDKKYLHKKSRLFHEKTHDKLPKPIQCSKPECDKKYLSEKSRLFHEKTHDLENFKFPCDLCHLKFLNQSRLLLHQEIHNPQRTCEHCSKTLKSKQLFNVHIQRCRNEFKFPCATCGKKFVLKWKLDRHLVVHTGAKPYSCEHCAKKFSWRETLRNHVKSDVCKDRS